MSELQVLHVCQPIDGGVPAVVEKLMDGQVSRGMEVALACPPGQFAEAMSARHTVVPWPATRDPGPGALPESVAIRRIMTRLDPQIVHLHSSKAGLAGRLAAPTTSAVVFQPHAWSFQAAQGVQRSLALAWERWAARWTDAAICVSQAERVEAERYGLRFRQIHVVTNAVDTKRFVPKERGQARAQLGLPAQSPLAVCVGRLSVQKGFDLMLSCWRLVMREVPDARLVVVGDGPDRSRLEGLLGEVSGVSFVGVSADPVDWYAAADVVAVPSRWEGMALVPLEAMACERSLVGFDVEGVAECLGEARSSALVPVGDISGLSKALTRRLTDPQLCADEGRRNLRRVMRDPGWERVVEATSKIYEAVVASRPNSSS